MTSPTPDEVEKATPRSQEGSKAMSMVTKEGVEKMLALAGAFDVPAGAPEFAALLRSWLEQRALLEEVAKMPCSYAGNIVEPTMPFNGLPTCPQKDPEKKFYGLSEYCPPCRARALLSESKTNKEN